MNRHDPTNETFRKSGETAMRLSQWMRSSHRWLSIVFTVTVIANFVARALSPAEPPPWITSAPLPPLFLQLLTGLYLFALPYVTRKRVTASDGND